MISINIPWFPIKEGESRTTQLRTAHEKSTAPEEQASRTTKEDYEGKRSVGRRTSVYISFLESWSVLLNLSVFALNEN